MMVELDLEPVEQILAHMRKVCDEFADKMERAEQIVARIDAFEQSFADAPVFKMSKMSEVNSEQLSKAIEALHNHNATHAPLVDAEVDGRPVFVAPESKL